jgi:hypothetical protein
MTQRRMSELKCVPVARDQEAHVLTIGTHEHAALAHSAQVLRDAHASIAGGT